MDIQTFWVGQKPGRPMTITVLDSNYDPVNLADFTSVYLRMLDSDNNVVDLPASLTTVVNAAQGKVSFSWPSESIFTEPGEYVMQLVLETPSSVNYTNSQAVRVREFGGVLR